MVYKQDYSNDMQQNLLYDLRQSWAEKMDRYSGLIQLAKIQRQYQQWYELMILMTPLIFSRIRKRKDNTLEEFEKRRKEVKKIINEYEQTYLRRNNDKMGVEEITDALLDLEKFLWTVAEENNMHGTRFTESVI